MVELLIDQPGLLTSSTRPSPETAAHPTAVGPRKGSTAALAAAAAVRSFLRAHARPPSRVLGLKA